MKHLLDFNVDPGAGWSDLLTLLDPYRYVLAADDALDRGSREEAVALIAQAYLAFDVLTADCG
jgi:hypothetical protein